MRDVLIRALSGVLYVALLLMAIFSFEKIYLFIFSLLGIVVLYEFLKLLKITSIVSYVLLTLCVAIFCYYKLDRMATLIYLTLTITVNLYLIKNLVRPSERYITVSQKYAYTLFYIIGGVVFTILLPSYRGQYTSILVASIFALIWINDTFAFIVGKSIGKRKLLERISPNKTVEGFIGGFIFCCIASIGLYFYTGLLSLSLWLVVAVVTSICGTLGDLIQSQLKRQAGVKDSGRIMPGHGGLYDRLDSIIFAAPFLYLFLIVLDYVP